MENYDLNYFEIYFVFKYYIQIQVLYFLVGKSKKYTYSTILVYYNITVNPMLWPNMIFQFKMCGILKHIYVKLLIDSWFIVDFVWIENIL